VEGVSEAKRCSHGGRRTPSRCKPCPGKMVFQAPPRLVSRGKRSL
jgi:hypothetical protein